MIPRRIEIDSLKFNRHFVALIVQASLLQIILYFILTLSFLIRRIASDKATEKLNRQEQAPFQLLGICRRLLQ